MLYVFHWRPQSRQTGGLLNNRHPKQTKCRSCHVFGMTKYLSR